jgi:hypothetical protein
MTRKPRVVIQETIENRILLLRGAKVLLDRDLASLYGVSTKALNQAVKRNLERFPDDFMFQVNKQEKEQVVTNCDHLAMLKFSPTLPYVFTEQGIAMLSSVLSSRRAIQVNIQIMRTFTKLRQLMVTHEDLRRKIEDMEKKYDSQFKVVFEAIRELLLPPKEKAKPRIGFY